MSDMKLPTTAAWLEHKFLRLGEEIALKEGHVIEGYASVFGQTDRGGDIVQQGAYARSLKSLQADGRRVKMLWQHDPAEPIGVWDDVREDAKGLYVKGRLLAETARGREASVLIEAGAIDGLSIGYRTVKSQKDDKGRRVLADLELWEVSLVTFPMLPEARVGAKGEEPEDGGFLRDLAAAFQDARHKLAKG
ncbi:MAG: HK97 family phage prohead protease [Pseudomonadota bacterium]